MDFQQFGAGQLLDGIGDRVLAGVDRRYYRVGLIEESVECADERIGEQFHLAHFVDDGDAAVLGGLLDRVQGESLERRHVHVIAADHGAVGKRHMGKQGSGAADLLDGETDPLAAFPDLPGEEATDRDAAGGELCGKPAHQSGFPRPRLAGQQDPGHFRPHLLRMHADRCPVPRLPWRAALRLGFGFVDWSVPVSTLVGAIVGVGSTMLADRSRWKQDRSRERDRLRRESYRNYLAAVIQAHEAMRAAANGTGGNGADGSPESKRAAITEAFRSADPYVHRFDLSLVAPTNVVTSAVAVFRRLRDIRDLLLSGAVAESAEYRAVQRAYYDAIKEMSDAMRQDLGSSPLGSATMGGPLPEADDLVP